MPNFVLNSVNNYGNTAGILSGNFAQRPSANAVPEGTMYVSWDSGEIYSVDSASWVLVSGGGGANYNPTPTIMPVFNGSVFIDSYIQNDNVNQLIYDTFGSLFKFDYSTKQSILGDWNNNTNGSRLIVDDFNTLMYSSFTNVNLKMGFSFDYNNADYRFGCIDFFGEYFQALSNKLQTITANQIQGLLIDGTNKIFQLGDFTGLFNATLITVDDVGATVEVNADTSIKLKSQNTGLLATSNQTIFGDIQFVNNFSYFGIDDNIQKLICSSNLLTSTAGGNSGQHIKIEVAGIPYVIELKNP